MKKSKVLLSTLAAAVFATSAGALVACGEDVQLPDGLANKGVIEITFNANGGKFSDNKVSKTVKTDLNGLISLQPETPEYNGYVFTGYYLEKDGKDEDSTKITYGTDGYKFTVTGITVYAHWDKEGEDDPNPPGPVITEEFKITLDVGAYGTCSKSELETKDHKLSLPNVEADDDHIFNGWYTAPQGGARVTNSTEFDKDGTIYAQYSDKEEDDPNPIIPTPSEVVMTVGGEASSAAFTKKPESELLTQYNQTGEYYAENVTLNEGDEIAFTINGNPVNLWRKHDDDAAQDARNKINYVQDTNNSSASLTVSEYGTYTVSVTNWDNAAEWVVWVGVPTEDPGPTPTPDAPARVYTSAKWNGTAMEDNTANVSRVDEEGNAINATLADEFKAHLVLTEQTTVTFTIGDSNKPTNGMWVKHAQAVQVKIGDTLVPYDGQPETYGGANSANGSIVLAAGAYDVYLTNYGTAGNDDFVLWVEGEQTGEFGGGGQVVTPTPDVPARVYTSAKWNGTAMEDNTANVSRVDEAGEAINTNLADEFKAHLVLTEQTTVTFTIGDSNKPTNGMWVKHAQAVQVKIGDTLVPYDGQPETYGGANSANGSIVLAAGAYDVYLTNYGTAGNDDFVLWVEGEQTGEFGGGGGEQTELPNVSVKNGAVDIALVHNPDNTTATYEFKLATGDKISLTQGDVLTVLIDGESPAPNFNIVDSHGATYVGNQITITSTGEFIFYLRYYEDGEWWNVEINDGKTDTVTVDDYYVVGDVTSWTNCLAGGHITEAGAQITVAKDQAFKVVICADLQGGFSWDTGMGIGDVTVGAGYVKSGANGNIVFKQAGTYTVKVVGGKIQITSDTVELPDVTKDIDGYEYSSVTDSNVYYLVGAFIGEDFVWNEGYVMKSNGDNEVKVEGFVVEAGAGIKIRIGNNNYGYANVHAQYGNKDWVETDGDGNIVFKEAGTYKIYFNKNDHNIYLAK